jgi:hypothetical protein
MIWLSIAAVRYHYALSRFFKLRVSIIKVTIAALRHLGQRILIHISKQVEYWLSVLQPLITASISYAASFSLDEILFPKVLLFL